MPRYIIKPARALTYDDAEWSDGEPVGHEVVDDGTWSEDQPTGILGPDGQMIWRCANSIGFLADL